MPGTIHDPDHERLVALLRDTRRSRGLRQADVAEKLGVPQSFVSKYETGERRLDLIELRRICEALDLDVVEFVRCFEGRR